LYLDFHLGNEDNTEDELEAKAELARKQEQEMLAKNKDVSLLLQHSKLKKLAEARQVISCRKTSTWAQCYKTLSVRYLRIFVES
jgi:hypothetical protein